MMTLKIDPSMPIDEAAAEVTKAIHDYLVANGELTLWHEFQASMHLEMVLLCNPTEAEDDL